ncbi:putative HXT5-hexose transporter [Testicularia cyperi]|uniref:Putative HXT5-hexose transporter n=1 Tax=Testicularia cyperi TaxID=1882483 RepID=A0A317XVH1_9BASI|nr:putative HXT5-hexose transporter [Testicularia cyperi]
MTFQIRGTPIGYLTVFIAILASMGGFLFGWDTGQVSGLLEMEDFRRRFATVDDPAALGGKDWNPWVEGVLVSLLSVGTAIGVLIGAPLADGLGRRWAMVVECIVFDVGVVIQVTSFQAWYQVAIGRLVTGLGVGALSAAVPLYQSETVPRQVRGALVGTYQLFITLGILLAYCTNIGTRSYPNSGQWRVPIALGIFFSTILAVGIMFCPESPRWLARRGRNEEAYKACAAVRGAKYGDGNPWVEAEYQDIIAAVKADENIKEASWFDCFKPKNKTLYRTLLGMVLQAGQQFTGANYFFYFGTSIFTSVGLSDSFVTQIILGAVNFACTFLGLYVLERFGRRWPLIIGAGWQSFWLFVFAIAGVVGGPRPEQISDEVGKLLIVSACMFILGYASTWAPGIWIFVGETFSYRTRAKQASLATLCNWIANFLISYFSSPIANSIYFSYGFIFAGCNLVNMFIAYFFVYETADLTLEAVDAMYCDPNCKAWQSTKWVPAGYSSRDEVKGKEGSQAAEVGEWSNSPSALPGEQEKNKANPLQVA